MHRPTSNPAEVFGNSSVSRSGLAPALLLIGFASGAAFATPVAVSTFDVGLDGWTASAPSITWVSSGGNPGGFASFTDNNSINGYAIAPSKFLGDYTAHNGTGTILFDYKVIATGTHSTIAPFDVRLSGPGGEARWEGPNAATLIGAGWVHFEVPIDDAHWEITSGTWAGLLANVTQLAIMFDPFFTTMAPPETIGMDNIELRGGAVIPLPPAAAMAAVGICFISARHRPRP